MEDTEGNHNLKQVSEKLGLSLNNVGKNIPILTHIPCEVVFEN